MKVLITGSSGFIGSHLAREFKENGYDVICSDIKASENSIALDIMNNDMIQAVLVENKPDVLVNMAGQANVALSWKNPQLTMQLNSIGVINILESVRIVNPKIRVLVVGSADEYGRLGDKGRNVTEDIPVNPVTPYAISKQTQELFARLYVKTYGLDVCLIRLFNLGGPGQDKGYMISDFSSAIAEIESGLRNYMSVGNLESSRDFTHVIDACNAIRLIVEKGHSGEIYNICSGKVYKAKDVLNKLLKMTNNNIEVKNDPSKMRPSDTPVVCGNHDKLTLHTGWQPKYSLDQILFDSLSYWRTKQ